MKIISWNVQGLKGVQVLQEITFLLRVHKRNMLFLIETLVNESNLLRILPNLGFAHFDYILPLNHSGGIAVLWNSDNILASVLSKEQRAIHMLVHDTILAQTMVISGIYAPAQPRDKDQFWDHLVELNSVIDSPWCLIGDFNEIGAPADKRGGITPANSKFLRLNHFLDTIHAGSIPVDGRVYT